MTGAETSYNVSQGFEVLKPKSGKAFPIPCNEWEVLKSQIEETTMEPWLFHTVGSLILGAALATFISILTGVFSPSTETSIQTVIAWSIVAVCGVCGVFCLYFSHKERRVHRSKTQNVLTQMRLIEQRFDQDQI